eukprot:SAG11_NODE_446_length_9395_cov_19.399957_3_plen_58_part_00
MHTDGPWDGRGSRREGTEPGDGGPAVTEAEADHGRARAQRCHSCDALHVATRQHIAT